MKVSLCIEPVLPDVDFYGRIAIAGELGFDAVEFWDTFRYDPEKIAKESQRAGIPVVGCILKKGAEPSRGVSLPAAELLGLLRETIAYAKVFGCTTLYALAGDVESRADSQKNLLIENLKRCADVLEKEGVTLLLEPLNSLIDHKGHYLDSSCVGFEIVNCVGSPRVKLLYDAYHMQVMEGNVIANMTRNIGCIGHIHLAGTPGRHEPQLGELNYKNVIRAVEAAGYDGYFGLEYWPTGDHRASLADTLRYLRG